MAEARRLSPQATFPVLVDDRGLPRVRCTSGNPLDPPDDELGDDIAGTPWLWFTPAAVATVNPTDRPLPAFPAIDLETGAAAQIPARH